MRIKYQITYHPLAGFIPAFGTPDKVGCLTMRNVAILCR
jgi:hypothetical protein